MKYTSDCKLAIVYCTLGMNSDSENNKIRNTYIQAINTYFENYEVVQLFDISEGCRLGFQIIYKEKQK